jgi:OOP family OmpA-OmpF porin
VFQGELSDAVLAGHADSTGTATYNLGLSLKRATAVQTFLINKYYIQEARFILKAYGEDKPIATNLTDEGRAKNRRVEFIRVK